MASLLQREGFQGLSPLRLLEGETRQPLIGGDTLPLDAAQAPVVGSVADVSPALTQQPQDQGNKFRDFVLRAGGGRRSLLNTLSAAFGQGTEEIAARKRQAVVDRFNLAKTKAAEAALTAQPKREIIEDAAGRKRFLDDKSLVFPEVKATGEVGFTNVTQDSTGAWTGLNKQTKRIEEIPSDFTGKTGKELEFADKKSKINFEQTDKLIKNAKTDKRIDNFIQVTSSMDRLSAAAEDPTGASDVSMIFSFMKMLDPGSVVRESEFQLASDTAGAPEFVKAAAQKLIEGQRLTDVSRGNFITEANKIFARSRKTADVALRPIEARAKKNNLDPTAIRNSIFGIPAAAPSQFKEGDTATGPSGEKMVFRGGQWQSQ